MEDVTIKVKEILRLLCPRLMLLAYLGEGRLAVCLVESLEHVMHRLGPRQEAEHILHEITEEVARCKACALQRFRHHVVVGEGNPRAELAFVGEGPGEEEDLQGRPFVGAAGKLLDRIIRAMGFEREQVYIANVVKCRPPGNRTPRPEEVEACRGFLFRQLKAISPRAIVALGAVASNVLVGPNPGITRIRGVFHKWEGIPVMPTYHPSYLLRYPEKKRDVWEDMKKVLEVLGRPVPRA